MNESVRVKNSKGSTWFMFRGVTTIISIEGSKLDLGLNLFVQFNFIIDLLHWGLMLNPKSVFPIKVSPTLPYTVIIDWLGSSIISLSQGHISYTVSVVSQLLIAPRLSHWYASIQIVRYMKRTRGQCVLFRKHSKLKIEGFTDAN